MDRPAAGRDRADGLEDRSPARRCALPASRSFPEPPSPCGLWRTVVELGDEIGYPLIIKAAAGGGGKGMELVADRSRAAQAFEAAQRQGLRYFADETVYVERYLENPRHVEAQILADAHGNGALPR